ncbi:DUF721 domain-containing protein [Streptomyces sp. NPDC012765]|uniref:DUF721 domain-containing protein n=1 Tax=Streptomyces sp. NPDC012765 TaxID=3155249 RepID=UPI0033ED6979
MTTTLPPSSGADLARIALRQAKEAARRRGAQAAKPKATIRRVSRSDGRDLKSLSGVLDQLVVDRGWEKSARAGDLLHRWPEIVGAERAHHWRAAGYDQATQTLTVVCDSPSWAASLTMLSQQVIAEVNRAVAAKQTHTATQAPQTLAAIKVRRGGGQRTALGSAAPADPAPRSRPDPTPRSAAVLPAEYLERRALLREAKLARDVARRPLHEPFTPFRLQGSTDDLTRAHQEEQARAAGADLELRARRQARIDRAARTSAAPQPVPQPPEYRSISERTP